MTQQTDFKIRTDLPIPKIEGGGRKAIYPWHKIPVGGSFFTAKSVTTMNGPMHYRQKKHGEKWKKRTVTEDGVKGTRLWRIE